MLVCKYLISFSTHNEILNIILAEIFLDGQNSLKSHNQLILCAYLLFRMQTVITVATVFLFIILTEIVEQHLAATYGSLGISSRLLKELATDVLLSNRLTLHKLVKFVEILMTIEGKTDALAPVSAGTSGLLVITFEALGDIIMNNETDIGFVNAHTESNGCYDNIYLLHKEVILRLRACGSIKSCMICCCLDVVSSKNIGKIFHLLTRETIYDTALARMLANKTYYILIYILCLGSYLVIEIWTVERTLELLGIDNAEAFLYVSAHLVGSSGSQGNHRSLTYLVDNRTDATVFRAEIMSPFRNTVSFIHCIERNLYRLKELNILILGERLWCNIQQFAHT